MVSSLKYSLRSKRHITLNKDLYISSIVYVFLIVIVFKTYFLTEFFGTDFLSAHLPNYDFLLTNLHRGIIPFWQPYNLLGTPLLFKSELALFYPGIFFILSLNFIFNPHTNLNILAKSLELLLYFHIFVGCFGTFFLLFKKLRLHSLIALIGGLVYGFSLYNISGVADIPASIGKMYFPFVIIATLNFVERNTFKNFLFLIFVNFIILSSGYPNQIVYVFLAEILLISLYGRKIFIQFLVLLCITILLSSFFLLENIHTYSIASRFTTDYQNVAFQSVYAFSPTLLINTFIPLISGTFFNPGLNIKNIMWGTISLLFLLLGFTNLPIDRRKKITLWGVLTFIFGFILSLGGYLHVPTSLSFIPFAFDRIRSHYRALMLPLFTGTIILSFGLQATFRGIRNKSIEYVVGIFLLLVFLFLLFGPAINPTTFQSTSDFVNTLTLSGFLLLLGVILYITLAKYKSNIVLLAIFIITFLELNHYFVQNSDQVYIAKGYTPKTFYLQNSLVPEIPSSDNLFRYIFVDNQFYYNSSPIQTFQYGGYDPVIPNTLPLLETITKEQRIKIANVKYIVTRDANFASGSANLQKITTVLPQNETHGAIMPFDKPIPDIYYIYLVKNYLPRFYAPQNVTMCQNNCPKLDNNLKTVYVKALSMALTNPQTSNTQVTIKDYSPNSITLQTQTDHQTFISSSENWDPGWKVTVNDKKSTLYNVSGFRGFIIPKGNSIVKLSYFPPYLLFGCLLSLMGLLLIVITKRKLYN